MNGKSGKEITQEKENLSARLALKEDIQNKAAQLLESKPHLILQWATSVGKTLAALKSIIYLDKHKYNDESTWYIVCKEKTHIENWKEELTKHNLEHLSKRIKFFCYASLHKYKDANVTGLILDECHAIKSDKRVKALTDINFNHIIALSATIDKDAKKALKQIGLNKSNTNVNTVTLLKAIELGIVPEPKIYIKSLFLENKERNLVLTKVSGSKKTRNDTVIECTYSNYRNMLASLKRRKIRSYTMVISCNEQEYYNLITEEMEYHRVRQYISPYYKLRFLNLGSTRKRFMSEVKTAELKKLLTRSDVKESRKIVFTGSISQCNEVGDIDNNVIHSNLDNKEVLDRIKNFNSKAINSLYSVNMARESINLTDIETAVIVQLDSKALYFYQKLGRSLRGEYPTIFILCIRNTQDEKYLETILDTSKLHKYVKYI